MKKSSPPIGHELALAVSELMHQKKAVDVVVLDLRTVTSMADYFVVCSADTEIQVKAIADSVELGLKRQGLSVWHSEGYEGLTWVILDYVDVVVHVFRNDIRHFYALEKLWGDAPSESIEDMPQKKTRTRKAPAVAAKKAAPKRVKKGTAKK